jgi:hypothetical protein
MNRRQRSKRAERRRDHRIATMLADAITGPGTGSWFYISFVDPDRPKGTRFLGGCYVQAENEAHALAVAHVLGCNPGGEASLVGPLPDEDVRANVPDEELNRLLTREEVESR